jgi:mRNA-degrading endonuclease RelE of RelBE toxin-antitoxin system
MMNFEMIPEFDKDFKRLKKKNRSLPEDLSLFKKVLEVFPKGNSKHFTCLTIKDKVLIIKARLFCRYLKNSSLRIIYAYDSENNKIWFIELYFKGYQENENGRRIEEFLNIIDTV